MPTRVDSGPLASELRVVLGHLIRRLRSEHRFSLSQGSVLGRLDREGPQSTSKLASAERWDTLFIASLNCRKSRPN